MTNDHRQRESEASERAEILRKRYRYRRLILTRRIGLSPASAARLIGPDCAYHLYRYHDGRRPSADGAVPAPEEDR
jgi:hypothetical protein